MKYHLGKPKKRVSSQFRISDHFSFQCGKLDLFTSASLYLFYISLETTLSRKGGEKRFCETIPQLVHTLQAGLPCFFRPQTLGPKFNAPWVQSKVTSWNTPVIRAELAKKVTTKSADNQSVQKVLFTYFAFIVSAKSEFWFPEAVKAPAWFLSLVCAEVKWQFRDWNDSLTHLPVSRSYRFDPEGSQSNLAESDDAHEK